jgi:Fe-S cluster assembly protein SufD
MPTNIIPAFQGALGALNKPFFAADRRREALERFEAEGFPTARWESWRHTDVTDVVAEPFQPARLVPASRHAASRYAFPGEAARLVFVNGFFAPKLSEIAHLPEGVEAGPLAHRPDTPVLGSFLSLENAPFAALNTALFPDGAFVRIERGISVGAPIHLIFLTVPDNRPTLIAPRVLACVGENARATIVETHGGGAPGHLAAAVTEVDVGPAARLEHVRCVTDLGEGAHVGHLKARQARGSVFVSHNLVFGGSLVRNEISVGQEGEGAECSLDGVILARGRDRVDNLTVIDHAAPRGTSRETYKYLLDGRSRGVFKGEILIRPAGQKSDAAQSNANLLLSNGALMHTTPDLRIFADDVKARHGAAIGRLDKDMMFYGRSRGLAAEEIRRMLIKAFAADVLSRIACDPAREAAVKAVGDWWEEDHDRHE